MEKEKFIPEKIGENDGNHTFFEALEKIRVADIKQANFVIHGSYAGLGDNIAIFVLGNEHAIRSQVVDKMNKSGGILELLPAAYYEKNREKFEKPDLEHMEHGLG